MQDAGRRTTCTCGNIYTHPRYGAEVMNFRAFVGGSSILLNADSIGCCFCTEDEDGVGHEAFRQFQGANSRALAHAAAALA